MHLSRACFLSIACLAIIIGLGRADSWERFRGPNGTGTVTNQDIPITFDEKTGILWKVPIPGIGNSCPIVWENRLFVQSSSSDKKSRMLLCLDALTGETIWSKGVTATAAKIHEKNSLASSTPATDGEVVCTAFWDGSAVSLVTYDFKGERLWSKNLGVFVSEHGAAASPIIYKDKVIFSFDSDQKAILYAFNKKDGTLIWEAKRKNNRASYSAPIFREQPGQPTEMIVASTTAATGYNPDDGTVLWNWTSKYPGKALRLISTPLLVDNKVILFSGDGSSGDRYASAVNLHGAGKNTIPTLAWDSKKDFPYISSGLTRDNFLYVTNDPGFIGCYDARTGKKVWYERMPDTFFVASPVMVNDHIYACSEEGEVFVFQADSTYKLLAKNTLGERIRATPAVAGQRMYIRGETDLFCIGKK